MIQNVYRVTKERYMEWGFENMRKNPLQIFLMVLGFIGIGSVVILILNGSSIFKEAVGLAFFIYIGFFRWRVRCSRQYKLLEKSYGPQWQRVINFDEDAIHVVEGDEAGRLSSTAQLHYNELTAIKEKDNKIWLYFSERRVLRLYKDCFIDSDWKACKARIREARARTGLKDKDET